MLEIYNTTIIYPFDLQNEGGVTGHQHGLTVLTTAIFAVGEMAGAGVLALPFSMVGTGEIWLNSILCISRE